MNDVSSLSSIIDPNSPVLISLPVVFFVFKILFLVAFATYIVYALVIVRQQSLMSRAVSTHLEGVLQLAGILHLVLALLVWVLAFLA